MGSNGIRTIVAATDFSETAGKGLQWAEAFARRHGARLVVVHVFLPPAMIPDYTFFDPGQIALLRGAAARRIEALVEGIRRRRIPAEGILEIGSTADSIVRAARRKKAQLLVIGTRGTTGFKHLLLGSSAERILRTSDVPVLAVHPQDPSPARKIRTILVPTDFSRDADSAIGAAGALLGGGGRIVLLHACHLTYDYAALGDIPPVAFFERVRESIRKKLEKEAARISRRVGRVDVAVRLGFPVDVILNEARGIGADLIAMGTHGRTGIRRLFLGSTAERVVQHAHCPVLTVKK